MYDCLSFSFLAFIFLEQIQRYMQNTHAKTHSGYTVDIVQIFRISRQGENDRFEKVNIHWSIFILTKDL